jgi:hypothetical protein
MVAPPGRPSAPVCASRIGEALAASRTSVTTLRSLLAAAEALASATEALDAESRPNPLPVRRALDRLVIERRSPASVAARCACPSSAHP